MQGGSFGDKSNKQQLIPENNLIKELSRESATEIVEVLNSIKDGTNSAYKSMDEYLTYLGGKGKGYVKDYVKENQNQVYITDEVINASKKARQAQLDHNEAIKASTLSAKAGKIALQGLAMVGNMLAGMLLSWGVSKLIEGIDNLIHAQEKLKKSAEEAISTFKSSQKTLQTNKKTIDSISSDYERLSKGVDEFGNNISLNAAEYSKYNEIVNQIADMFPQMVQGYTDEGNAILTLKGNVEELTKAYEASASAARQSFIATGNDIINNIKNTDFVSDYKEVIDKLYLNDEQAIRALAQYFNDNIDKYGQKNEVVLELEKIFKEQGIEVRFNNLRADTFFTDEDVEYYLQDEIQSKLQSAIKSLTLELEGNESIAKSQGYSLLEAMFGENYTFTTLPKEIQDYIKTIAREFDHEFYAQFENKDDMFSYVLNNLVLPAKDGNFADVLTVAFNLETQFNNSEITVSEYQKRMSEFLETIKTLPKDTQKAIKLIFGIETNEDGTISSSIDTLINNVKGKLKGTEFDEKVGELNLDNLQIAAEQVDVPLDSIESWEELLRLIEQTKKTITSVSFDQSAFNKEIESYEDGYSKLIKAQEEWNESKAISPSTFVDLEESGLLEYIQFTSEGLEVNTEKLLENAQSTKDKAVADLHAAMTSDLLAIAMGNAENISAEAQNVIAQLGENTEVAGNQAMSSVSQWATLGDTISQVMADIKGEGYVSGISEEQKQQMSAVYDFYKNLATDISNIDITLGGSGSGGGSGSKSKSDFKETIDFFERRIDILNDAISRLKSNLENVTGSFTKNNLIDAQSSIYQEELRNYTDALAMYQKKANEVLATLPDDIAEKVKNGAIDLTTFVGESSEAVVDAIGDYQNWADRVSEVKLQLIELQKTLSDLELEKFNNVVSDFSSQFDLRDNVVTNIDKHIALLEEQGQLIGASFYDAQIQQSQKQLALLEQEKIQLVEQMNSALASGNVKTGSEAWLEMVSVLSDVEGQITDCKKSIEEFSNEILELNWKSFERVQDTFSDLNTELENFVGLLDDIDVADDKGNWSTEAKTKLGLLSQQYELAVYQVGEYRSAIEELKKQYTNGDYSAIEFSEKLAELSDGMWDATNSANDLRDAIVDLNEQRVDKEINSINESIEAYEELVDAQIKSLNAEKD